MKFSISTHVCIRIPITLPGGVFFAESTVVIISFLSFYSEDITGVRLYILIFFFIFSCTTTPPNHDRSVVFVSGKFPENPETG